MNDLQVRARDVVPGDRLHVGDNVFEFVVAIRAVGLGPHVQIDTVPYVERDGAIVVEITGTPKTYTSPPDMVIDVRR